MAYVGAFLVLGEMVLFGKINVSWYLGMAECETELIVDSQRSFTNFLNATDEDYA